MKLDKRNNLDLVTVDELMWNQIAYIFTIKL